MWKSYEKNWSILPFGVLVHMSVALYAILLNEEFHALVKGRGHAGRLFTQKDVHGIITSKAHDMLCASCVRATLAVRTVHHAIWETILFGSDCSPNKTQLKIINFLVTLIFDKFNKFYKTSFGIEEEKI